MIVASVSLGSFWALQQWLTSRAGIMMAYRLQKITFAQIMNQDLSFFANYNTGELTTALTSNIAIIQDSVSSPLAQAFKGLLKV